MSAVSFEKLVATIGIAAADLLCENWGGTTITVPARPRETHPMARRIGHDAARKLYREFGHVKLSLPLGPNRGRAGRQREAAAMLREGWSATDAALKADVHERTVWRIKAKIGQPDTPLLDALPEDRRGAAGKRRRA